MYPHLENSQNMVRVGDIRSSMQNKTGKELLRAAGELLEATETCLLTALENYDRLNSNLSKISIKDSKNARTTASR